MIFKLGKIEVKSEIGTVNIEDISYEISAEEIASNGKTILSVFKELPKLAKEFEQAFEQPKSKSMDDISEKFSFMKDEVAN